MINLAVINLKELSKYLKDIIIVALSVTVIFIFVVFYAKRENYIDILSNSLSIFKYGKEKVSVNEIMVSKEIINSEIAFLSHIDITEKKEEKPTASIVENEPPEEANEEKIVEVPIPKNVQTVVNTDNNKKDVFNVIYEDVKIKNESKYTLTDEILIPNVDYSNRKDIIIFHTHTCESYTQTDENPYTLSGNFRTTDLEYSVAKVGSVLSDSLQALGFNVIHSENYHDYPAYTGSYSRSMNTVKKLLTQNPDTELVIDLHRDAIGSDSAYGPSVQIGEERVAQLMFVIGTDGGGLEHPNWQENLKLAVKIQKKANEMYPGLFKPMIVRNSRYNQNLAKGACIIEVGATGNTLEEATGSMKYLANIFSEVMK